MTAKTLLTEYLEVINDIYGVYLDATQGFKHNILDIENDKPMLMLMTSSNPNEFNKTPFEYQSKNIEPPTYRTLHSTTLGEFKTRNDIGGRNYITLGNLCITQLYHYWDYYRNKIEEALGLARNGLKSDLFGDLRHFRRSIIHNRGFAIEDIEKCKILKWFNKGELISLNKNQIEEIIFLVKAELENLIKEECN